MFLSPSSASIWQILNGLRRMTLTYSLFSCLFQVFCYSSPGRRIVCPLASPSNRHFPSSTLSSPLFLELPVVTFPGYGPAIKKMVRALSAWAVLQSALPFDPFSPRALLKQVALFCTPSGLFFQVP